MTLEEELEKFLEENPEMREYQKHVDEILSRASEENRINVLKYLLEEKYLELVKSIKDLQKTLEKVEKK